MGTTTIRVDTETHARLAELARERGETLMDAVAAAAEELWKVEFAKRLMAQYEELRKDPEAWEEYLAEFDWAIADGIDD